MSVLIKGMNMPKNCGKCEFSREIYNYIDGISFKIVRLCQMTNIYFDEIDLDKRLDNCPLVEVKTPHGELIDRDAFIKDWGLGKECNSCDQNWKKCMYDRIYSKEDFCGWIDDPPVVIEAEE